MRGFARNVYVYFAVAPIHRHQFFGFKFEILFAQFGCDLQQILFDPIHGIFEGVTLFLVRSSFLPLRVWLGHGESYYELIEKSPWGTCWSEPTYTRFDCHLSGEPIY